MNQKTIVTVLAVIGALVVAGWVLKIAFHFFVPLLVIGGCVAAYLVLNNKRIGGPK